jgi:hypothetical protein
MATALCTKRTDVTERVCQSGFAPPPSEQIQLYLVRRVRIWHLIMVEEGTELDLYHGSERGIPVRLVGTPDYWNPS